MKDMEDQEKNYSIKEKAKAAIVPNMFYTVILLTLLCICNGELKENLIFVSITVVWLFWLYWNCCEEKRDGK